MVKKHKRVERKRKTKAERTQAKLWENNSGTVESVKRKF